MYACVCMCVHLCTCMRVHLCVHACLWVRVSPSQPPHPTPPPPLPYCANGKKSSKQQKSSTFSWKMKDAKNGGGTQVCVRGTNEGRGWEKEQGHHLPSISAGAEYCSRLTGQHQKNLTEVIKISQNIKAVVCWRSWNKNANDASVVFFERKTSAGTNTPHSSTSTSSSSSSVWSLSSSSSSSSWSPVGPLVFPGLFSEPGAPILLAPWLLWWHESALLI